MREVISIILDIISVLIVVLHLLSWTANLLGIIHVGNLENAEEEDGISNDNTA